MLNFKKKKKKTVEVPRSGSRFRTPPAPHGLQLLQVISSKSLDDAFTVWYNTGTKSRKEEKEQ
jgi:hypothetical protein